PRALFLPQPARSPAAYAGLRRPHGASAVRAWPALRSRAGAAQSALALRARLPAAARLPRWLARTRVRTRRVGLCAAQVPRAIHAQPGVAGLTTRPPGQGARADRRARAAAAARPRRAAEPLPSGYRPSRHPGTAQPR